MNTSTPIISSDYLTRYIFPILENIQLPVAIIEPKFDTENNISDFSYVFINEFGSRSYSLPKEEILSLTFLELFPLYREKGLFDKLKSVFNNNENLTEEVVTRTNIRFNASKFDNYILINWIDTTVIQNQLSTIKILQNSNEELEQFAYIASHDLQEPIRMVISFTQLLQRRYADKLDDDAREFIAFAVDGAQRMKLLIDNLLIYSRANIAGKIEIVSVESVINDIIEDFKILIGETGTKIIYENLPDIYTDKSMLSRLLTNLISNAVKFKGKEKPVIKITVEKKNSEWVFSVADNGIGIEEKYFEKVFMIFQKLHVKTKYPGTGLGLAISKKIVEKLGGRMWLTSQPDIGSIFYFTIPVKEV